MERNPYAPPSALVADIANDSITPTREVLIACKLVWVSFGLSLVTTVSDVLRQSTLPLMIGGMVGAIIGATIGFAITKWIVSKLKSGRNWMRLVMTIFTVLGYLSVPIFWKFYSSAVFPIYASDPIKTGFTLLGIIPNTWAIVLLNIPSSRAWFSATTRRE
jgi:hypothetical protein